MGIKADNLFLSTLPARGATGAMTVVAGITLRFLSTLPARGATRTRCTRFLSLASFLSTLPARGATVAVPRNRAVGMQFLSTLPARGATMGNLMSLLAAGPFLSTLPARGATRSRRCAAAGQRNFYPRSPRGERPLGLNFGLCLCQISIHAPREGSDIEKFSTGGLSFYFYPRSPRGERPSCGTIPPSTTDFYPRSPRGERRAWCAGRPGSGGISIHAPREGSD